MEQENQTSQEEVKKEVSPVEQEALAQGWVPKEEFHGEEHKWVDAAEFLRRGELFAKIEDQSKTLKELRKALKEMQTHHANVRETEYKRALDELKSQRKEAFREGDADKVIELEEKIELVKEEQQSLKTQSVQQIEESQEPHPAFKAWVAKNSWYSSSKSMKAFADTIGRELASQGLSPTEVLAKVEEETRKEFPEKFKNPNREKPGSVEGKGSTKASSSNANDFELSEDERRIMNSFVRSGVLTKEQYIADLKRVKGIQ